MSDLLTEVSYNIGVNNDTINVSAEKYAALFSGGAIMINATENAQISNLNLNNIDIPALFYVSGNKQDITLLDVDIAGTSVFQIATSSVGINQVANSAVLLSLTQEDSDTSLFGLSSNDAVTDHVFGT